MKIKFDAFTSNHFSHLIGKNNTLYYDTKKGELCYKNGSSKIVTLADQQRNLKKLDKILASHPDNDDYGHEVFYKERKILQTQIKKNNTIKNKSTKKKNKTKKLGFFIF